jgi:hypothetical protein
MNTPFPYKHMPPRSAFKFTALLQTTLLIVIIIGIIRSPQNLSFKFSRNSKEFKPTDRVSDHPPSKIPVFYNLFVKSEEDVQRVQSIVTDQFARLNPNLHHPVYVHSIGHLLPLPNTTLLGHHSEGFEDVTLHSVWDYCKFHNESKVVYLHSKGSYTPTPENEKLRRFLTFGALSESCANLPPSCNVCSTRFSPLPHPHTSGNMFLARCDYVAKLKDPRLFQEDMAKIYGDGNYPCSGTGRYSAEHWIHSHPAVRPCDLYTEPDFVWNYGVRELDIEMEQTQMALQHAPRFHNLSVYFLEDRMCHPIGVSRKERLDEYHKLYNETPGEDWWGWDILLPDS